MVGREAVAAMVEGRPETAAAQSAPDLDAVGQQLEPRVLEFLGGQSLGSHLHL
jgi:hypothetical protein